MEEPLSKEIQSFFYIYIAFCVHKDGAGQGSGWSWFTLNSTYIMGSSETFMGLREVGVNNLSERVLWFKWVYITSSAGKS